jgi:O-antigen/teichoic acid export membrane protein
MSSKSVISSIRSLKDHKGFMRYFKNTSWLFAEKIFKAFAMLFVGVWVARYLGPEQFGVLSYATSFVFLFSGISTLGLDYIVVRELVKNQNIANALLGTSFFLKLCGAFLSLVILWIISDHFISNYLEKSVILIIAFSALFHSFKVIDFYFQSKVISRFSVYTSIFSVLLSIIVKIVLILNKAPLIAFAYAFLFDAITLSLAYIFFYLKQGLSIFKWHFEKHLIQALLKDSWPLILSSIFISIYMKIDQVMIKAILDAKKVGEYAAAATISEAWYFIPSIIAISLFPAIINAKKQNEKLYYSRLKNLYILMFWLAFLIAIPTAFFSDWIINLFYGKAYLASSNVLKIHVWAGVFVSLGVSSSRWLIAENLQVFALIITAIGAMLNIILNYFFIYEYGISGAAWATVISYFVSGYFAYLFFRKTRNNFFFVTKSIFKFKKYV